MHPPSFLLTDIPFNRLSLNIRISSIFYTSDIIVEPTEMLSASACHICLFPCQFLYTCSKPRCKTSYCENCIASKIDTKFNPAQFIRDCWVCYACAGRCGCVRCMGIGLKTRKRIRKCQNSTRRKPNFQEMPQAQEITHMKDPQEITNTIKEVFSENKLLINRHFLKRRCLGILNQEKRIKKQWRQTLEEERKMSAILGYQD